MVKYKSANNICRAA